MMKGTQGFFLLFERSAAVPADTSGFLCLPALAGPPDSRGRPRKRAV